MALPPSAQSAQGGPPRARDLAVLVATILASAMGFIDGNIVTIALPDIRQTFRADVAGQQWVVEAYLLTLVALLLTGGALGDVLGRRRVFLSGVVLFALASGACGLAQTIWQLVAARALQGVGAALLVPGSLALITAHFDDDRRGAAIGTWSAFSAITVAFAPLLGGWLIETGSWRLIFWINIPLAAIVIAISLWNVPESRDDAEAGRVDWLGAVLATVGLAGLVFALIELPRLGAASPFVWAIGLGGLALLVAFILAERRMEHPMLPLALFRCVPFSGAVAMTVMLYAGLSGLLFFLPIHLIEVLGYGPLGAGAAILPFIILISTLSRFTGGMVDRFGARLPLTIGPTIAGIGFLLHAVPGLDGSYWTTVFPAIAVVGLGMALTVAPLTTATMNAAPRARAGTASGISNAASRFAFLIAVAGLGLIAFAAFMPAFRIAAADLPAGAVAAMGDRLLQMAAATPPEHLDPGVRADLAAAIDRAALAAFRTVAISCAALAFAGAVLVRLTFGPKGTNRVA